MDRIQYRKQCAAYNKLLSSTRIEYTRGKITACKNDQSKLFKLCNSIVGLQKNEISIDGYNSDLDVANGFSSFFQEKVEKIVNYLNTIPVEEPDPAFSKLSSMQTDFNVPSFNKFKVLEPSDVENIMNKSNSKTCALDVFPPRLLKLFSSCISKPLSIIINSSLQNGVVPSLYKEGIVRPGLKKPSLDSNIFSNFRPVTNLSYFSKTLERCVFSQLEDHLNANKLIPSSQSAYRKLHSTETSLLKVSNDILAALNDGKCTLLVTLDLSAAFDTVNHQMLLERYRVRFGMNGTVLSWMTSYLQNRTQSVQVGSSQSDVVFVKTGFPQGSVLGGPKYTMHTTPLDELIDLHDVDNQAYADDSNLYISFDLRSEAATAQAFSQMEHCLADVEFWMTKNELQLNCSKTVVVLFKPPNQIFSHQPTTLKVGSDHVGISSHFESLGVVFDQHMETD